MFTAQYLDHIYDMILNCGKGNTGYPKAILMVTTAMSHLHLRKNEKKTVTTMATWYLCAGEEILWSQQQLFWPKNWYHPLLIPDICI